MKLRVLRVNYTDTYTQGEAYVYKNGQDVFSCYTIENPWLDNKPYVSCIPTGTYKAFRRTSPSNGNVIELKDVPNRTFIQFHVANFPEDVKGCIGVGLSKEDGAVYESKKAMNEILGFWGFADGDITVQIWDIPDITPGRIETRSIDPAVFEWDTSFPVDYIEEVDEGKGLQRAKEIAEDALQRSQWKRRAAIALNGAISLVARITRIPELNHLKLKTEKPMKRVKPYLKQKSTWEGVAAILGAVGVTIYPGAIVEIVAGVFVIIGGIEMWKEESEEQ